MAKAFLPGMGPTGIHFLSHLLEDNRIHKITQQVPSEAKELVIANPEDNLKLEVESKTSPNIMNNNLEVKIEK